MVIVLGIVYIDVELVRVVCIWVSSTCRQRNSGILDIIAGKRRKKERRVKCWKGALHIFPTILMYTVPRYHT